MKLCRKVYWIIAAAAFSGCGLIGDDDQESMLIFSNAFDFSESNYEWLPGFADYPAGENDSALFELQYAYTDLVTESKLTKRSIRLSGKNLNRDLFMYLKKRVTGLQPNTEYTITFNVELASNVDVNHYNTAGSVYLKAGATSSEPHRIVESGSYVMNLDKGNADRAGADMINLGDLLVPEHSTAYTLITLNNAMANNRFVARTNSDGELWLIVGTDSTIGATTTVYYTRINVVFSAS